MRERCLSVVAILALVVLAAALPTATAQVGEIALSPSPAAADAYAGDAATFRVALTNPGIVDRTVTMVADAPPVGWTYNFTPMSVHVPKGGANNTTLVVYVPADAQPGTTVSLSFRAQDGLGASPAASVNVTVQERPAPAPGPEPQRPALELSVTTGDQGLTGDTVQGILTLRNADASRASLSVEVGISGSSAWNPRILPEDRNRVLPQGGDPAEIPVRVSVPALAQNQTETFTLTAKIDSFTYTTTWTVRGIVRPPSADDGTASPTPAATPTSPPARATPTTPAAPGLSVIVVPQTLDIAPGEDAAGVVRVTNTGGVALRVTLAGSAADSWPVRLNPKALDLAPGETKEVELAITAPLGIPVGGLGAGTITATSDSGLVRNAPFRMLIVEPSIPRDETPAAAVETPATPDGGVPASGASVVLVAAALGTVGAGALALANRPLREKAIWLAVGLYTRLARPDILGHEDREKLYRLVETQPGIHFHALQRDLGWNTGTLTYHLRVLEKHGFMVSRRDGLYRRFYLSGAAPRKEVFENAGPQGLRADVLEAVRNQHGISQSDLALALGANKQTVNYHVKALERQGAIRVEKRGRDTYLYPSGVGATGEVVA